MSHAPQKQVLTPSLRQIKRDLICTSTAKFLVPRETIWTKLKSAAPEKTGWVPDIELSFFITTTKSLGQVFA